MEEKTKEKAQKLVERFGYVFNVSKRRRIIYRINESRKESAIKHALITIDEVLKEVPMYTGNLNKKWKYWNDVKMEIEKL